MLYVAFGAAEKLMGAGSNIGQGNAIISTTYRRELQNMDNVHDAGILWVLGAHAHLQVDRKQELTAFLTIVWNTGLSERVWRQPPGRVLAHIGVLGCSISPALA